MCLPFSLHINCRIHEVDVFVVQLLAQEFDSLPKPLEVDNFPFPQELDDIVDIGIIRDPQDVVIGHAGLLLWYIGFNTK